MSIYGKRVDFNFGFGKAKTLIIAILIIAFIILAGYVLLQALAQAPLSVRFEKNPWVQSELHSNLLFVKVVNTTGQDAKLTVLEVKPRAQNSLLIFPQISRISETLAPNDSRILTFNIRNSTPSQRLPPGNYTIDLKVSFDKQVFTSEVVLQIE